MIRVAGPGGAGLLAAGLLADAGRDGLDALSGVLRLLHPAASSVRAAPAAALAVSQRLEDGNMLVRRSSGSFLTGRARLRRA